jgi:hypothetical protein
MVLIIRAMKVEDLTSFSQAAGITDVTLRNTIKDLKNRLLLLN